ncbi:MAG: hypothetical protein ACOCVR_01825, partial [Myxococcota bacterium]
MPSIVRQSSLAALLTIAAGCGAWSPECGPDACDELGYECGQQVDACGDALDCGDCGDWHECQDAVCVCVPQSCESLELECGTHDDRCGDRIECGACAWPLVCDAAGMCVEPDEPPDVLDGLLLVPGLNVQEVPSDVQGTRAFLLELEQPEFHTGPSEQTFTQRMLLLHRHLDAPMVMNLIGYGFGAFGREPEDLTFYLTEPAHLLGANQLLVEHRFFGESIPESPNWTA